MIPDNLSLIFFEKTYNFWDSFVGTPRNKQNNDYLVRLILG